MENAVDTYLHRLRHSLRRLEVPDWERALADATEFVAEEFAGTPPGYDEIVTAFGLPEAVARAYLDAARRAGGTRPDRTSSWAPGWKLTCVVCGRTGDFARSGRVAARLGAATLLNFKLGFCRECRRPRFLRLWRSSER